MLENTFGALASIICIGILNFWLHTPCSAAIDSFRYHADDRIISEIRLSRKGTVGACATLLTILFMVPQTESYLYAFNRVIDGFIGMAVAIAVQPLLACIS